MYTGKPGNYWQVGLDVGPLWLILWLWIICRLLPKFLSVSESFPPNLQTVCLVPSLWSSWRLYTSSAAVKVIPMSSLVTILCCTFILSEMIGETNYTEPFCLQNKFLFSETSNWHSKCNKSVSDSNNRYCFVVEFANKVPLNVKGWIKTVGHSFYSIRINSKLWYIPIGNRPVTKQKKWTN